MYILPRASSIFIGTVAIPFGAGGSMVVPGVPEVGETPSVATVVTVPLVSTALSDAVPETRKRELKLVVVVSYHLIPYAPPTIRLEKRLNPGREVIAPVEVRRAFVETASAPLGACDGSFADSHSPENLSIRYWATDYLRYR
jgi:hypothetical protein